MKVTIFEDGCETDDIEAESWEDVDWAIAKWIEDMDGQDQHGMDGETITVTDGETAKKFTIQLDYSVDVIVYEVKE